MIVLIIVLVVFVAVLLFQELDKRYLREENKKLLDCSFRFEDKTKKMHEDYSSLLGSFDGENKITTQRLIFELNNQIEQELNND